MWVEGLIPPVKPAGCGLDLLYAFTVLCLVYSLRAAGAKLSVEAVKQGAVLALFQFQDHPVYPQKRASIHAPKKRSANGID